MQLFQLRSLKVAIEGLNLASNAIKSDSVCKASKVTRDTCVALDVDLPPRQRELVLALKPYSQRSKAVHELNADLSHVLDAAEIGQNSGLHGAEALGRASAAIKLMSAATRL